MVYIRHIEVPCLFYFRIQDRASFWKLGNYSRRAQKHHRHLAQTDHQ